MELIALDQFSALFKDYVGNFAQSKLPDYFPFAPNTFDASFERFLVERAKKWQRWEGRTQVVQLMRQHHEESGTLSPTVRSNLDLLDAPGTVAIVTGQQVGLFGGPLYTFYKAATAISLCKRLKARFPDLNFVPIFWLETEDHDLEEAASTYLLDREFGLKTIRYEPSDFPQPVTPNAKPWRKQVGSLQLEVDPTAKVFAELKDALTPTEFTERITQLYEEIYASGTTFALAFAKLLHTLFAEDGLLSIDANNRITKTLAKELFRKEIKTSPELSERIIRQTAQLEEQYHAQVKPRALNLFYMDHGERFALLEKEGMPRVDESGGMERSFFLQGTKRTISESELLAQIDSEPERFSSNVVLRPLYQDTILPTVAYIAGPGEVAYFAQFKSAYEWAGLTMPMIFPRVTATLIEDKFEKIAQKQGLPITDVLQGGRDGVRKFLEGLSDPTLAPKFEEAAETIEHALESLGTPVARTDATLVDTLATLKGKMVTQLRDFLAKLLAADRKRYANVKAQFEKMLNALLPHEAMQERELNLIYFLNKYGWGFWDSLKAQILKENSAMDQHLILPVSGLLPQNSSGSGESERTSDATDSLVAIPAEENAK